MKFLNFMMIFFLCSCETTFDVKIPKSGFTNLLPEKIYSGLDSGTYVAITLNPNTNKVTIFEYFPMGGSMGLIILEGDYSVVGSIHTFTNIIYTQGNSPAGFPGNCERVLGADLAFELSPNGENFNQYPSGFNLSNAATNGITRPDTSAETLMCP